MDDVHSMVKNEQECTLFNHLNCVDPHIKFTMKAPGNDGSMSFLDIKYLPNTDYTIDTSVYKKQTHIDNYLEWNSNHLISAKNAVIYVLI